MTVIPTDNISPTEWAASLLIDWPTAGVPFLSSDDAWEEWAAWVADLPAFLAYNVPKPNGMTFRQWATFFYEAVGG